MRIDCRPPPLRFIASIAAPILSVAHKEPLRRREPVHRLQLLPLGSFLPRVVGQQQPAKVRHILALAERELAVDVDVVDDHVLSILIRDAPGALLELLTVSGRPPVAQIFFIHPPHEYV